MSAVGTELGRYRLQRLLGRGGMGEVYLAKAQGLAGFEKLVAVKLLTKHARAAGVAQLVSEAFISVRLDHEHVVQVLDLGDADGRYYLVMEYVHGFSLEHVLAWTRQAGGHIPHETALHVARAIASALDYAHTLPGPDGSPLGFMHRDVSPSNILLGADGRVKLSDFGVAALGGDAVGGGIVGKPPYLPPEAFTRGRPSPAWDVYALSLVLYECLAGAHVYDEKSAGHLLDAIRRGPAPLAARCPGCPPALAEAVERATHPDPARRLGSAAELRAALEAAVPRVASEADRHREFVARLYERDDFVRVNGGLPATGDVTASPLPPREAARRAIGHSATLATPLTTPLRFGLSPAHGTQFARAKAERLAARLQAVLGQPVRCIVVADYRGLAECLASGEVDFAWMPPLPYARAAQKGAGIVVAARRDGLDSYRWAVGVRATAAFESLHDLRGQSIAWVDRESASGYVYPAAEITRRVGALYDVFAQQHFLGSHQAVCEAVANGWLAACATYATCDAEGRIVRSGWLELIGERAAAVRPLFIGCEIPSDNISHRPNLDPAVVERLALAFTALSGEDEGRTLLKGVFNADSFTRPDHDLYRSLCESTVLVGQA